MLLYMDEMSAEIRPEELLGIIQAAMAQAADNVRMGRIASGGRGAAVNLLLPNGQTFRLSVEELDA
jgi:hypothetical protein